jgi:hypothetical protein
MKLKTLRKWIYRPGNGVVRLKMELQSKKWSSRSGNGVVRIEMESQAWKSILLPKQTHPPPPHAFKKKIKNEKLKMKN